jgi:hypothetical protein
MHIHPVGEIHSSAVTFAKYAAAGADVRVVSLTRGGACAIKDASLVTEQTSPRFARVNCEPPEKVRGFGKHDAWTIPMADWPQWTDQLVGLVTDVIKEPGRDDSAVSHALRAHSFDVRPPYGWTNTNFDVSRRLHRVALPHPGGDAELFQMVATLME